MAFEKIAEAQRSQMLSSRVDIRCCGCLLSDTTGVTNDRKIKSVIWNLDENKMLLYQGLLFLKNTLKYKHQKPSFCTRKIMKNMYDITPSKYLTSLISGIWKMKQCNFPKLNGLLSVWETLHSTCQFENWYQSKKQSPRENTCIT